VLDEDGKRLRGKAKSAARKRALSRRALIDFETWIGQSQRLAA
jgi:methylenetetrahydrofolate--tRNA-(uracil-5-)-methyltransferase